MATLLQMESASPDIRLDERLLSTGSSYTRRHDLGLFWIKHIQKVAY
jgi:hypothetical protein